MAIKVLTKPFDLDVMKEEELRQIFCSLMRSGNVATFPGADAVEVSPAVFSCFK
jgi:hypothetical protein